MAHFGSTVDDGIQRLKRRNQFTGGIDLNGQATAGCGRDAISKPLGANAQSGKVLGPGGDHAPGDVALGDCRRGKARGNGARADDPCVANK